MKETLNLENLFGSSSNVVVTETNISSSRVPINESVFLMGEIAPGFNIVSPISLTIEADDDGSYVVSDDLFYVYGSGQTEGEALDDYVVSLIDFYELHSAEDAVNPATGSQLRKLRNYLQVDAVQAA